MSFSHWTQFPLNRKGAELWATKWLPGGKLWGRAFLVSSSSCCPHQPSIMSPRLVKHPRKPALLLPVTCFTQKLPCCVCWRPQTAIHCLTYIIEQEQPRYFPLATGFCVSAWCLHRAAFCYLRMCSACPLCVLLVNKGKKKKAPRQTLSQYFYGMRFPTESQAGFLMLVSLASRFSPQLLSALYWTRGLGKIKKKKESHLELESQSQVCVFQDWNSASSQMETI